MGRAIDKGRVVTYLTPKERAELERRATAEGRSVANMVALVIREWLAKGRKR